MIRYRNAVTCHFPGQCAYMYERHLPPVKIFELADVQGGEAFHKHTAWFQRNMTSAF
jgi:hypothetical protein